jgi:hypothetical protein
MTNQSKFQEAAQAVTASFEEMRTLCEKLGLDGEALERAKRIDLGSFGPNVTRGPWPMPLPINPLPAALGLAAMGIPVFPCKNCPDKPDEHKRPLTTRGFKNATTDAAQVKRWWTKHPDALIGIPTGPASGIDVLDLDIKNGKDGFAFVPDWRERSSVISRTGSGGAHLWFASDGSLGSTAGKIAAGVDTRGTGGYFICPPSAGYHFEKGSLANIGKLPPFPDDLRPRERTDKVEAENPFLHVGEPADRGKVNAALQVIPSDDYDIWLQVGAALHREFGNEGIGMFKEWSSKSAKYNERACAAKWRECGKFSEYTAGTIFHYATLADPDWLARHDAKQAKTDAGKAGKIKYQTEDFVSVLPLSKYAFLPTREMWSSGAVNSQMPPQPKLTKGGKAVMKKGKPVYIPFTAHLDQFRKVQQMTWAPGYPVIINDKYVVEGGWLEREGATTLNLYRPPTIRLGDAGKAGRWLDLVRKVFPDDHEHLIRYFAQRRQHPETKINHGLVLGGQQGIGKDTIIEPVKEAVGPWNCQDVAPTKLLGRFNGHRKSVILIVSEARDLGEMNRYAFYEATKTLMAAPPNVLQCDEKNLREHYVQNVVGVIITTNHKIDGLYLPADDRRHYVAWSKLNKEDFGADFWRDHYRWHHSGGFEDVAAYLQEYDLSGFDPKEAPPHTAAWWTIVGANRAPEEAELSDIIDKLGNPAALTITMISENAGFNIDFQHWLEDRKNSRQIPHRLESCGYVAVDQPDAKDHLWRVGGRRCVVYANHDLALGEQLRAAGDLGRKGPPEAKRLRSAKATT